MYHLENKNLKITVASQGAELKSIIDKTKQQELLWQANPNFWAKSSPVLFPIVGTLKKEMFIYDKKEYKLPRHGFARDYNFKGGQISDNRLIFSLQSSAETLKNYPFLFRLQIIYTLETDCLKVEYKVENLSNDEKMFFSLGAHPAFKVGATAQDFNNHKLFFNNDSELKVNVLKNGLLTKDQNIISLENQKLGLNYKLFENDALVMLNLQSNKISLMDKVDHNMLTFEFENFPYFGLWTVKDSGFICLEPWAGFSDFEQHNQQIETKEGINALQPNGNWSAWWRVHMNNCVSLS